MNEALNTILQKVIAGVDTSIGFLSSPLPDVIHQLLLYNLIKSSIFAVILFLIVFSFYTFLIKSYKNGKSWAWNSHPEQGDKYKSIDDSYLFVCFIGGVLSLIPALAFLQNVFNVIQIWLAPKIWLIEYAADLVKGK